MRSPVEKPALGIGSPVGTGFVPTAGVSGYDLLSWFTDPFGECIEVGSDDSGADAVPVGVVADQTVPADGRSIHGAIAPVSR